MGEYETLNQFLKWYRTQYKVCTIDEMAMAIGISRRLYINLESSTYGCMPTPRTIDKISRATGYNKTKLAELARNQKQTAKGE